MADDVLPIFERARPFSYEVEPPAHAVVPPGVTIGFGVDLGLAFARVAAVQLEDWPVDLAELTERALRNLRRRARHARDYDLVREPIGGVPTVAFQSRDGWASTVVLVPEAVERLFGPRPALFIAPSRDLLVRLPDDVDLEFATWLAEEFEADGPERAPPRGVRMAGWHRPLPAARSRRGRGVSRQRARRASIRTGRTTPSARSRPRATALRGPASGDPRRRSASPRRPGARASRAPPRPSRGRGRSAIPSERPGVVAAATSAATSDAARADARRGDGVLGGEVRGTQHERDVAGVDGGRGLDVRPQDRSIRPGRWLDEPERVTREQRAPDGDLGDRPRARRRLVGQPWRHRADDHLVGRQPVAARQR